MNKMLKKFIKNSKSEYLSNTTPRTFPDGLDIEIFLPKLLSLPLIMPKQNMI